MRIVLSLFGGLLVLSGGVFFFQGINIIPGSFMTGQIEWAVYGGLLVCGAVALLINNNRRKPKNGNPG